MLGNKDRKSDMIFFFKVQWQQIKWDFFFLLLSFFFLTSFPLQFKCSVRRKHRGQEQLFTSKGEFFQDVQYFKAIMENK